MPFNVEVSVPNNSLSPLHDIRFFDHSCSHWHWQIKYTVMEAHIYLIPLKLHSVCWGSYIVDYKSSNPVAYMYVALLISLPALIWWNHIYVYGMIKIKKKKYVSTKEGLPSLLAWHDKNGSSTTIKARHVCRWYPWPYGASFVT
jgi:hypothetical protein